MIHRGTYDGTIYYNPANKFCIISVKTAEKDVPEEARSIRRRKDHLIRFVATGYELPRTDAVELELDGEWKKGKYGMQLQVEQWHEIVPQTKSGVEGYLASGLIKGIGPALAKQIVSRFGVETLDILQNRPERLLEIKGITENKLEAIKTSYAESRMLQDLMTLLSPFKITPKTAQKIYQFFGPASVDILKKSPFELCQISGFGFLRVDAIVQKNGGDLRAPMRIKGALFWALEDSKGKNGHLFLTSEALQKEALQLLNAKIPIPSLRLHAQEVSDVLEDMILHGEVVSVKGDIYLPRVFAQEDETARRIAMRVVEPPAPEKIEQILEQVKREIGLALSSKQEAAVYATYRHNLSIITGSPGTGKTTVLKTILEVYRRLHPQGETVEARLAQRPENLPVPGGVGVRLQSDLRLPGKTVFLLNELQEPGQPLLPQAAGGAAAKVDGVHRVAGDKGCRLRQMGAEGRGIVVHAVLPARQRVEITVRALLPAEWNMNIQAQGPESRFHLVCLPTPPGGGANIYQCTAFCRDLQYILTAGLGHTGHERKCFQWISHPRNTNSMWSKRQKSPPSSKIRRWPL